MVGSKNCVSSFEHLQIVLACWDEVARASVEAFPVKTAAKLAKRPRDPDTPFVLSR